MSTDNEKKQKQEATPTTPTKGLSAKARRNRERGARIAKALVEGLNKGALEDAEKAQKNK